MSVLPAIDFHCHSHFSDGALSPLELLELAKARDVQQLAITDHDTVSAYSSQLHALAAKAGITLVTGCEISCLWQRRSIHVVGLNLNLAAAGFDRAMAIQAQARKDRAEKITEVLQQLGFEVALPPGSRIGRGRGCWPATLCAAPRRYAPDTVNGDGF